MCFHYFYQKPTDNNDDIVKDSNVNEQMDDQSTNAFNEEKEKESNYDDDDDEEDEVDGEVAEEEEDEEEEGKDKDKTLRHKSGTSTRARILSEAITKVICRQ